MNTVTLTSLEVGENDTEHIDTVEVVIAILLDLKK